MGKIEKKGRNADVKNITALDKILNCFEVIGNKLPDPVSIFLILCIAILIISFVCSKAGVAVEHPLTHNMITAENLLNKTNTYEYGNSFSNLSTFRGSISGNDRNRACR